MLYDVLIAGSLGAILGIIGFIVTRIKKDKAKEERGGKEFVIDDNNWVNELGFGKVKEKAIVVRDVELYLRQLQTWDGKEIVWKKKSDVFSDDKNYDYDSTRIARYDIYKKGESHLFDTLYFYTGGEINSNNIPKSFEKKSGEMQSQVNQQISDVFKDNERQQTKDNKQIINEIENINHNRKESECNININTVSRKRFIIVTAILAFVCVVLLVLMLAGQGMQDVTASEEYKELQAKYNTESLEVNSLEAEIDYIYSNICIQKEGDNVYYHKFNCDTLGDSFYYTPYSIDRAKNDHGLKACPICF